jgi:hypothetical protein
MSRLCAGQNLTVPAHRGEKKLSCGDSIRVVYPLFQEDGGGSTPTSPLQLHVGTISTKLAIELVGLWHSRLPYIEEGNVVRNVHSICFGAEYGNKWYAAAIWSSPVARMLDNQTHLELRRFAIADDAPKNTASRVLRIMTSKIRKKIPTITTLVSYQDCEVHTGTIYRAAGWVPAVRNTGGEWSVPSRARVAVQSAAPKVRWEKEMATC